MNLNVQEDSGEMPTRIIRLHKSIHLHFSDDTEYYCGGYYTCAVTSTLPAAAWQTYYYHDKYYDKFAICGGKSTTNPNTYKLQDWTLKFRDRTNISADFPIF